MACGVCPVSYTHLDVYKRQVKGIGLKTVEKNRDRIEVGRAAAPAKQAAGAAAAKAKPVARR